MALPPATTRDEHEDRMRRWYGLTPAQGDICFDWLHHEGRGGRCPALYNKPCPGHPPDWFLDPTRVMDHARTWRDSDGRKVITAEPYNPLDPAALAKLADEHDLEITVSGKSPWYPGWTTLVMFRARPHGEVTPGA